MSEAPNAFHLQVLGPVTIRASGDVAGSTRVTQPRPLALLCYLALARPRGLHSRDSIMAMLWPRHDDAHARRALRNALHELRRALGGDVFVSAGDDLIGIDLRLLQCDAYDVERDSGTAHPGPPLDGFHVSDAAPFERWCDGERDRLQVLVARATRPTQYSANPRTPDAQRATTSHGPPHEQTAYSHYLRGHYLFLRSAHGGNADDLHRAKDCFDRALTRHASYAPALAGLANYYAVAARRELLTPFDETFDRTIALSHEALAVDGTLAVPHVHFGVKAWFLDDQLDAAGECFARAVEFEPTYAEGRRFHGAWLSLMGRTSHALREMEEAVRLEPDIALMLTSLAAAQLAVGDDAAAEITLRRTLTIDSRHAPARERYLRLLERQGRFAEAVQLRATAPSPLEATLYAEAFRAEGVDGYHRLRQEGLWARAHALEARLVETRAPGPRRAMDIFSPPEVQLVAAYAELGEWRRVRSWELLAVARRPALATWFRSLPELAHRP